MSDTPLYEIWKTMKQRCHNSKNKDFRHYGGRGIFVCAEWQKSFSAFHVHVTQVLGDRPDKYSIDRIDNNRGYEPGNVKWSSQSDQIRNARRAGVGGLLKADGIVVARIKELRNMGHTYAQIAADVKIITDVQCRNIFTGKRKRDMVAA